VGAAAAALRAAGIEAARLEAEVLLSAAAGWSRTELRAHPERQVPAAARSTFEGWVERRLRERVPVQYLTRRQEFWSLDLHVDERVLIPRPETECLVEELLKRAGSEPEMWIDVGTGSGAVALALASERADCRILALDISPRALEVARLNCRRHPAPGSRVWLAGSDLLEALAPRPGIARRIAANLPYLAEDEIRTLQREVAGHEPRAALVAGAEAARQIERLVPQAARALAPGGSLHLEIAPGLTARVTEILGATGAFGAVEVRRDGLGLERVVSATRSR
jgi:release factor glutamine methyltransferase